MAKFIDLSARATVKAAGQLTDKKKPKPAPNKEVPSK